MSSSAFRALLEAGDVSSLRAYWSKYSPNMPQPRNDEEAEIIMHHARTTSKSISFKKRAWSHRWLTERLLPSGLPDNLKPSAERMYPTVAESVGISVNFTAKWMKPAATQIQKAMSDAVEEAYADNRREPEFVKTRIQEARQRTQRALFGG